MSVKNFFTRTIAHNIYKTSGRLWFAFSKSTSSLTMISLHIIFNLFWTIRHTYLIIHSPSFWPRFIFLMVHLVAFVMWGIFFIYRIHNISDSDHWEPEWTKTIGRKFKSIWTEISRDETQQEKIEKERIKKRNAAKRNEKNKYKRCDILDIDK